MELFYAMDNPNRSKQIYVDLDDVISRTTDTFSGIIESEFGKKTRFEQITSFNLQESFNLKENEYDHFFDLIHTPEVLLGFEPVQGAKETLDKWSDLGWHIDVVTGRPASALEPSLEWLKRYGIPFNTFTMVDKYGRQGKEMTVAITKEELAKKSYDLAVEDSWEMALFLAATMEVKVALYDRPWNSQQTRNRNIQRFFSWSDIEISTL